MNDGPIACPVYGLLNDQQQVAMRSVCYCSFSDLPKVPNEWRLTHVSTPEHAYNG